MIKIVKWLEYNNSFGLTYKAIFLLLVLSLTATAVEVFAIGVFLPIIEFIRADGDLPTLLKTSELWREMAIWLSYIGVKPTLPVLLSVSFTLFLVRQIVTYIRVVYNSSIRHRLIQKLKNKVFGRYMEANTDCHDQIPIGDLSNIVNVETPKAISGIFIPIEIMAYLVMLLGYIVMLMVLSLEMTVVSILVLLVAIQTPKFWIKKSKIVGRKLVSANTKTSVFLINRLKSPRLVRLSNAVNIENKYFTALTLTQRKYAVEGAILNAKTDVTIEPVVVGLSFVFLYISFSILAMPMEIIGVYLIVLMRLMPAVKAIVLKWQSIQSLVGSIDVVEKQLENMLKLKELDTGVETFNVLNESITLSNVSYRYSEKKKYALNNVSVVINSGEITAIVGPSGSGKSTLIDLIPRIRIAQKGFITFDHKNINRFTLKSLRHSIAYAPQSVQIFGGTVREHLLYGNSNASEKDMLESVRLSGLTSVIDSFPQGFDTNLGEGAVLLSGGQRQRLDLARILIKKTSIIILDEPTGSLDAESEKIFTKVLKEIQDSRRVAIIIVTHSLSNMKDVNKIIVLNKGAIEATGTHDESINKEGWYSKAQKEQKVFC